MKDSTKGWVQAGVGIIATYIAYYCTPDLESIRKVIDHSLKVFYEREKSTDLRRQDAEENLKHVINPSPYESQDTYKMPNGYLVTVAQTDNVALNAIIKTLGASRQIGPNDPNATRLHITEVSINTSTIVGDCTPLYAEINYQLLLPKRMDKTIRTAHSKQICLNRQPDRDRAEELAVSDAVNDLLQQLP